MLIDTHAHLWFPEYKDDLEAVLERAKVAGVEKIIVPGTDLVSSVAAIELTKKYPGIIYAAVGIHPEEAIMADATEIKKLIAKHREIIVAVGEIGMDMSNEELIAKSKEQAELFREQCEIALELDLPVIIHTRQSLGETLEVLDGLSRMPRGQFHCFSHDEEGVKQVLARGFYVSFCNNISWSKRVARLVPLVPEDRLILETDSPLMKPGERNEPAQVEKLAEVIAQIRGTTKEKIAECTSSNATRLYRL